MMREGEKCLCLPEGKITLGRPRRRQEDIIKIDINGIECEDIRGREFIDQLNEYQLLNKKSMSVK